MGMHEPKTSRIYDAWSWMYDKTFGPIARRSLLCAIDQLRPRPGQCVLDIGVGTGLTLPHYPSDIHVVGLDLSAGMLAQAQQRCDEHGLSNCELVQGDALAPPFAGESFDHIMITYTVSVVSDPALLMRHARRMLKPGGRVVIVNHFQSVHRPLAVIERLVNPLCNRLGWRSDLPLVDVLAATDLKLQYQFKRRRTDLFTIVVLRHPHRTSAADGQGHADAAEAVAAGEPVGASR